jgi:hypothetical protein
VIRHRLQVFAETTGLLVPYYTERGILVAVDADQPPDSSRPTSRPSCPPSLILLAAPLTRRDPHLPAKN